FLLARDVLVALDADVHRVGLRVVVETDILDIEAPDQLVGRAPVGTGDDPWACEHGHSDAAARRAEVAGHVPGRGDRGAEAAPSPDQQDGDGGQAPGDIAETNDHETPSTLWLISSRSMH